MSRLYIKQNIYIIIILYFQNQAMIEDIGEKIINTSFHFVRDVTIKIMATVGSLQKELMLYVSFLSDRNYGQMWNQKWKLN